MFCRLTIGIGLSLTAGCYLLGDNHGVNKPPKNEIEAQMVARNLGWGRYRDIGVLVSRIRVSSRAWVFRYLHS